MRMKTNTERKRFAARNQPLALTKQPHNAQPWDHRDEVLHESTVTKYGTRVIRQQTYGTINVRWRLGKEFKGVCVGNCPSEFSSGSPHFVAALTIFPAPTTKFPRLHHIFTPLHTILILHTVTITCTLLS
jgi:hypothetical protein